MNRKVELDATYPHPPESVWKALTNKEALSRWLMPTDFEPILGLRFRFRAKGRDGENSIRCKVIDVQEPHRLAFTWEGPDDEGESIVSWTLQPTDDGGTRVRIEHELVEAPAVTCLVMEASINWQYLLRASLPTFLRLLAMWQGRLPRPPMVYVTERTPAPKKKRSRRTKEKVTK